jgi:hypothetical protein
MIIGGVHSLTEDPQASTSGNDVLFLIQVSIRIGKVREAQRPYLTRHPIYYPSEV